MSSESWKVQGRGTRLCAVAGGTDPRDAKGASELCLGRPSRGSEQPQKESRLRSYEAGSTMPCERHYPLAFSEL